MTTGQLIKSARKKAGLTQKELGGKLGVAYQTVAQWENDLRNPKIETLNRIATALGVEMVELSPTGWALLAARRQRILDYIENDVPFPSDLDRPSTQESLRRDRLMAVYDYLLNEDGKKEAVKRVLELAEISKYQAHLPEE